MVNKVFLIGRLGKDPVIKHFENGGAIAEFTLATDDTYKDRQGNKVEQTDWHNIKITFPKLAEVAEKYLKKGSLVHIEGKIKTRSYDDKDGHKRYVTEVVVEGFKMLDSKKESNSGGGGYSSSSSSASSNVNEQAPATTSAADDDLPF
jgi:single-strand DNA-binding protein